VSPKPTANKTPIAASIPAEKPAAIIPSFDALPDGAFIREAQLVQSPKHPNRPAPLPFSAPTLWRKVKAGTFPKPVKLSERVTAWKVGDIRAWAAAQATA
jgi:prophage regulatory protein